MDLNSAKRQAGREKEMKVSKGEKRERERGSSREMPRRRTLETILTPLLNKEPLRRSECTRCERH